MSSFWSKVRKTRGCWHWEGACTHDGYGRFKTGGHEVQAARWAYEHEHGTLGPGFVLRRTCGTPGCVRPSHMEPITEHDRQPHTTGPAAENAAKAHCDHGHVLSGENLYVDPDGKRKCRTCMRDIQERRKKRFKGPRRPKPDRETLATELEEYTAVALGEHYGVSDTTVRNWARRYGLV